MDRQALDVPVEAELRLSGRTKVAMSLGYPITQSLSPEVQTTAFRSCGLDWIYIAWGVRPEHLAVTVQALRGAENFAGGNVTAPHKERIVPLLDGLTPAAERLQAVNVILRDQDRLIGDSTDGAGALAAVREAGWAPRGMRVLLLGAGGAARAVGCALVQAGVASVWVCNRTLARAKSVAALLQAAGCSQVRAGSLAEAPAALGRMDWVVNATSVGLQQDAPLLFDYSLLCPPLRVLDLVFFPRETPFLKQAREQGCATLNGVGMLLHQAALSFERWTGLEAPTALMRVTLTGALDRRERTA
ncbi:MAG TPA: shikimate dehydrogenase [Candidatus Methylomirabilis sp.]|nr:shikimate dehydrogenase [Candidatus Methylomirabilis sp.]